MEPRRKTVQRARKRGSIPANHSSNLRVQTRPFKKMNLDTDSKLVTIKTEKSSTADSDEDTDPDIDMNKGHGSENSGHGCKSSLASNKNPASNTDASFQSSRDGKSSQTNTQLTIVKVESCKTNVNNVNHGSDSSQSELVVASVHNVTDTNNQQCDNDSSHNNSNSSTCTETHGDVSTGKLHVTNASATAATNGTRESSPYLYRFRLDKDSSSSESSNLDIGDLEDDSEDMTLRLSDEDENINFTSSSLPTSSISTLFHLPNQITGDSYKSRNELLLCKGQTLGDNPSPALISEQKENGKQLVNTNYVCPIVESKGSIISVTDNCSKKAEEKSDDNFEDLISTISSKDTEIAKKKNDGVTVSDLEDFLNDIHSNSDEVSEKSLQTSEVCTQNKRNNDDANNCCGSVGNEEKIQNLINTDKESSIVADMSPGSTVSISDNVVSNKNIHQTLHNDDKVAESKDSKRENSSSSKRTNFVSNVRKDIESKKCDDQSKVTNVQSNNDNEVRISNESVKLAHIVNSENINLSGTDSSNDSMNSMQNSNIKHVTSKITSDQTNTYSESNSTNSAYKGDANHIGEPILDKLNHFPKVKDVKSDDVKNEVCTQETDNSTAKKRSLKQSVDEVNLKKQKINEKQHEDNPQNLKIETESRNILESDQTIKRTLESPEKDVKAKKARISDLECSSQIDRKKPSLAHLKYFKEFMESKGIQKMSREALEEFTLQKICEAFNQHSRLSKITRELQIKELAYDSLRSKYGMLKKQMSDLEIVQTRISNEMRKVKDPREIIPVKITRSVGLQVSLQPLKSKGALVPSTPTPPHNVEQITPTSTGTAKKKTHRSSAAGNRTAVTVPTTTPPLPPPPPLPPTLTPAPTYINRSPTVPTGKGIKTILPKVYSGSDVKENASSSGGSLLGTMLQKQPTPTTTVPAISSVRKSHSDSAKVIDLTEEDDSRASSTVSSPTAGNIRVVAPHQLTNNTQQETITPIVTTNMPRLTYLVQTPGQQCQPVLLATTTAPTRPGQARPTIMFKPLVSQGAQRLNLVRPASTHVPGTVAVLPPSLTTPISTGVCKYVTTSYTPARAIAPAPRHPAPLPGPPEVQPGQPTWKMMPPKPSLKITLVGDGIVLSWRILNKDLTLYEEIASYQLYAYHETNAPPSTDMWRKVGDVKALALPMACTLTQFTDGNKYHFAVRGVDVKSRVGPFSTPEQITLPAH